MRSWPSVTFVSCSSRASSVASSTGGSASRARRAVRDSLSLIWISVDCSISVLGFGGYSQGWDLYRCFQGHPVQPRPQEFPVRISQLPADPREQAVPLRSALRLVTAPVALSAQDAHAVEARQQVAASVQRYEVVDLSTVPAADRAPPAGAAQGLTAKRLPRRRVVDATSSSSGHHRFSCSSPLSLHGPSDLMSDAGVSVRVTVPSTRSVSFLTAVGCSHSLDTSSHFRPLYHLQSLQNIIRTPPPSTEPAACAHGPTPRRP